MAPHRTRHACLVKSASKALSSVRQPCAGARLELRRQRQRHPGLRHCRQPVHPSKMLRHGARLHCGSHCLQQLSGELYLRLSTAFHNFSTHVTARTHVLLVNHQWALPDLHKLHSNCPRRQDLCFQSARVAKGGARLEGQLAAVLFQLLRLLLRPLCSLPCLLLL